MDEYGQYALTSPHTKNSKKIPDESVKHAPIEQSHDDMGRGEEHGQTMCETRTPFELTSGPTKAT